MKMMKISIQRVLKSVMMFFLAVPLLAFEVEAKVDGIEANSFTLTAKEGYISTADGGSIYAWGYANGSGPMQYPGVTMIVNQGDTVTVTLNNDLTEPVSILFPGQKDVTATGGVQGLITREAPAGGSVTYSFVASEAGSYLYNSGTNQELQIEMGLVGAIVVRPYGFDPDNPTAYSHPDTDYEYETLFLLTEMDSNIHDLVEAQGSAGLAGTDLLTYYKPNYWFINGRTGPDTLFKPYVAWLPNQPYNAIAVTHPGDKILMRVVNAGRDLHPFHHHGNDSEIIARNGRLLETSRGAGPDLGEAVYTIQAVPGGTYDAIFAWTGANLGWDIYGTSAEHAHDCIDTDLDNFDDTTSEFCPDHGKEIPVMFPQGLDLTYGGFWSGSPYLGVLGSLPPGEGGLNPTAGFFYMWHSHTEKELTNYDIFPGGMMSMLVVVPSGVRIAK